MAKQTIGIGTNPNDGSGDPLRTAGTKVNDNFSEIYSALGNGATLLSGDVNFGSGGFHQITIGFNFLRGSIECDCF